jgi:D-3-phosphoglycerate dehydrogenase
MVGAAMYRILTLNKMAPEGMGVLAKRGCLEASGMDDADAVLVRSADMRGLELGARVLAVARAGAGYNNIPVELCSERGVVVFNTPGANANAVKELTLAALFLSSRRILAGVEWTKQLQGSQKEIDDLVEKGKSNFEGPELAGKTLGVVGLGAIGVAVANGAAALDMEVIGYDPYISVDAAWNLSRSVRRAASLEHLLTRSDYVTIHVPFSEATKDLFNAEKIARMKRGARLINLSRGGLAKEADVLAAINAGVIACYVTDFPTPELSACGRALCIPHLGASTPEAKRNCARTAAGQLLNYLETGTIKNAVNFPDCALDWDAPHRLLVANKNIPNMVGQITTLLAGAGINITDLINHHKDKYAYNIIDTEQAIPDALIGSLEQIEGVVRVRTLQRTVQK